MRRLPAAHRPQSRWLLIARKIPSEWIFFFIMGWGVAMLTTWVYILIIEFLILESALK